MSGKPATSANKAPTSNKPRHTSQREGKTLPPNTQLPCKARSAANTTANNNHTRIVQDSPESQELERPRLELPNPTWDAQQPIKLRKAPQTTDTAV